jgi:hypothetical protein
MRSVETYARQGLWALPAWAVLLFLTTLSHQPPYMTDFPAWSRYVTTPVFLFSHLAGTLVGAAIGLLGFVALAAALAIRGAPRLALSGLVTTLVGSTATISVFGVAAFAQPAIGRSYLGGNAAADPLYDDVNGVPLLATAALGVLLLSAGLIVYGVGVARTRLAPRLAGVALAVGGPLFSIVGVLLANVVQSLGALLIVVGTAWLAWAAGRGRARAEHPGVA